MHGTGWLPGLWCCPSGSPLRPGLSARSGPHTRDVTPRSRQVRRCLPLIQGISRVGVVGGLVAGRGGSARVLSSLVPRILHLAVVAAGVVGAQGDRVVLLSPPGRDAVAGQVL